jgi:hypothetical protein
MISTQPKPIRRIPVRARVADESRDDRHDPADLAATLRDLAARAHRAVRALDAAPGRGDSAAPPADALRELAELHPRIVELQHGLEADSQRGLASYLSALRREVESRLG